MQISSYLHPINRQVSDDGVIKLQMDKSGATTLSIPINDFFSDLYRPPPPPPSCTL